MDYLVSTTFGMVSLVESHRISDSFGEEPPESKRPATSTAQIIVDAGNAKLIFDGGVDGLDAYNALGAGDRGEVVVELDDGSRHPAVFYDNACASS